MLLRGNDASTVASSEPIFIARVLPWRSRGVTGNRGKRLLILIV
jgi:hypothetical protein